MEADSVSRKGTGGAALAPSNMDGQSEKKGAVPCGHLGTSHRWGWYPSPQTSVESTQSSGTDRGSAHPATSRPRGQVCGEPHLVICAVRGGVQGPAGRGPSLWKGPFPTCSSLLRKLPTSHGMVQERECFGEEARF